ncbi:MAG: RnfABCDGE type electron transport complex subunit D [Thiothrix sp.]|uniref:RnfABCDGE type electron transport complex subunit D n=1 Tax=Thiothrix sp. TaxID=1032 RepID=UPI0026178C41|nr:RnfABCDGE type electron transport complex subunit D [Thiothrix sp.]MDD5393377.1 RnfABCDGE type electron transport complex subunit D [Thiothrix sp.]
MSYLSRLDPRHYQLTVQTTLLLWGIWVLEFPITWQQILAVIGTALLTQRLFCYLFKLPNLLLSTLNTSLSVLLLLHAQAALWLAVAAALGIASKFLLRLDGKHVFNPSNFGIVIALLLTSEVWAAPGQWGHGLWLFLLIAGSGLVGLVGWRTMLATVSFLLAYTSLLFLKAWWLGDPWTIPQHQLQNGSLLLFSFFMLSDPKTTPAHPLGRVLFGVSVALLAVWLQFRLFLPNAFLYALLALSPSVFLFNRWLNYPAFEWSKPITKPEETP